MIKYRKLLKEKLPFLYKFYNTSKGFEKIISRKEITNFNISKDLILKNNKFFSISGKKVEETNKNISESIPSVMGWVPFIDEKTSIVIFNFFSINYAIRGQFYLQLSIVKNNEIINQKNFWIPADICHEFNLKILFPKINGDAVFVEMFNPKLSNNHGGHDGHLRFWGKYYSKVGNYLSTVHSSQHSKEIEFSKKANLSRDYIYKNENVNSQLIRSKISNIKLSKVKNSQKIREGQLSGFNILNNSDNDPCAIWHHGVHKKEKKNNLEPKKSVQSFWCPPNKYIDPAIVLDGAEGNILINKGLLIYIIKDSKIIKSKFIEIKVFFSSKISEIFNEFIEGPYIAVCEYWFVETSGYIQVHYDSIDNLGDQSHAHICEWTINDNKMKINNLPGNKRSRKFFHIHKDERHTVSYLSIRTHLVENRQPMVKLRLITDKKFEFVKNIKLNSEKLIHTIDIKSCFPEYINETYECAVIQIESHDDNLDCDLIHINNVINSIAIDHLTGG